MKIKNEEISVDQAFNFADFDKMLLKRRENNLLLSDYQVYILSRNNIDFNKYADIKQLLFEIEEVLNDEFDEELDIVATQLAELDYYNNTKK